jgi:hypothetical protein
MATVIAPSSGYPAIRALYSRALEFGALQEIKGSILSGLSQAQTWTEFVRVAAVEPVNSPHQPAGMIRRVDFDLGPEVGQVRVRFVEAADDGDEFSW